MCCPSTSLHSYVHRFGIHLAFTRPQLVDVSVDRVWSPDSEATEGMYGSTEKQARG